MEGVLTVQHTYWTSWMNPFLGWELMMTSTLLIGCERNAKTERDTDGYLKFLYTIDVLGGFCIFDADFCRDI